MTLGRVDSTPSSISLMDLNSQLDVELAGDSAAEIAALLVLGARDSRNQASAAAHAEEQRMSQLEDQQVNDLYAQAEATRAAGWSRGVGQILAGGAAVLGAAAGAETGGAKGQLQSQSFTGAGTLAQGGLNMMASEYECQANVAGARATDTGNQLKHVERHLQQLEQEQSEASELARSALQTASELSRSQAATEQATIFLRG